MVVSDLGSPLGIIFQVFYGLLGSWTAYLISVLYVEYRARKEKENVSFKNHVIQPPITSPSLIVFTQPPSPFHLAPALDRRRIPPATNQVTKSLVPSNTATPPLPRTTTDDEHAVTSSYNQKPSKLDFATAAPPLPRTTADDEHAAIAPLDQKPNKPATAVNFSSL